MNRVPHRAPAHKTYCTPSGKFAGEKRGDTLWKPIQETHVYNSIGGGGIAWADAILNQAEADGCTRMEVHRLAKNEVYTCTIETFKHFGVERNHAGYGRQFVLAFRYWTVNGQPSEYERDQTRRAVNESQLQLGL